MNMKSQRQRPAMTNPIAVVAGLCAIAVVVGLAYANGQAGKSAEKSGGRVGVYFDTNKSSEGSSESSEQSGPVEGSKALPSPTPQVGIAATGETLQGLEGVRVVVKKRDMGTEKYGLTFEALQGEIESRLAGRGVRVISKEQYGQFGRVGILHIDVLPLIAPDTGFCAVSINVALVQNVLLTGQDPARLCQATTWERRTVALCDTDSLKEIPKSVASFVDQFIKDYLAANSVPQQPRPKVEPWSPAGVPQPAETPRKSLPPAHLMV